MFSSAAMAAILGETIGLVIRESEGAGLDGEEPWGDQREQDLRACEVGEEAWPKAGGCGRTGDLGEREHEEEPEVGKEGDQHAIECVIARETVAEVENYGVGEREEKGVGAKGDGGDGVKEQPAQEAGEEPGTQRKRKRGQGDRQRAHEHIETPRRECVIELRGDRPEKQRREKT